MRHPLRVAVTGGAGFIGANLCTLLCELPWVESVAVLDDLSAGTPAAVPPGMRLIRADILDGHAVDRLVAGADALVHLAARSSIGESLRDPVGTYRVNGLGSALVLDAARRAGVRHVVLASSAAVYGDCPRLPTSEGDPPRPISPYGASKLAAEGYALACSTTYGLPALVLRLFNVFGPGQLDHGQDGAVVPAFIAHALRGEPVPVNGDGTQSRDFIYVADVCRLIAAALERGVCHAGPVNVATGVATSLRRLLDVLGGVLSEPLRCAAHPARPGDVRESWADTTLLRQLFPHFVPTDLRDGLAATVAGCSADRVTI